MTTIPRIPRAVPDPTGWIVTRWDQDPFSEGSYSYLSKRARPRHRVRLRAPIDDRLFWAGEATSSDYPATVHGALLSGRDAASTVDRALTPDSSVVVIGAGVSGLSAAKDLRDAGHDVVVVEARDRIGGRVSTSGELGPTVDLGASWIHGVRNNPLTELADQLGMERVATDYDNGVVHDRDGSIVPESRLAPLQRRLASVLGSPQDVPLDRRLDEIRDDLAEPEARWFEYLVTSQVENDMAEDTRKLSDRAWYEGEAFGGDDVIHVESYAWLPSHLAESLDVRLGEPVTRIAYGSSPVRVETSADTHEADAVVVTIPLGVLKTGRIDFSPKLPAKHRRAIRLLGMGTLDKLYLRFDEVFWDEDLDVIGHVGRADRWTGWVNMVPVVGEPMLLGFNAGSAARRLERMTDERVVASGMKALRRIYG